MMKINTKLIKIFAIFLSALLVAGIVFPLVMAESNLLEGQKELFVKNVTSAPVQDGILNGHKVDGVTVDEYGANGPTYCLTHEDYRAIDLEGNPLNIDLPSYIYLYLAKDADALYLAMEIQEDPHVGDVYEFTTFLGFGSSDDADTMNSGTFTTFKMNNGNSAKNDPGTWMDTQVTALSAQKVAADGTVTNTTANRKFNVPYEYTLPAWASETKSGTKSVTLFEAELDFKDAMLGSGLGASASLPDQAYFAFELGVFDGTTKIGKIVFNNDMTGKTGAPNGETKTVPHVLNLKTEFKVGSANNANLSSLTVEGGKLSPAFDANTTEYTLTLPNGTTAVSVSAIAEVDETAVTVVGADQIDSITAGANNTITITCVAQNGYTKVYTLFISWAYDSSDYYVDSATGNDFSGNGSETTPYATIEKALQAVAAKEWKVSESATIHINGTFDATAPDGILFGAKTVFNKGATKLPISIKGDSKTNDVINLPIGNAACANDYTFEKLSFPAIAAMTSKLFAGSGNIALNDVGFGTITDRAPRIFADTFTAKVFEGWTATQIAKVKSQNERGNIVTSVSFGVGSDHNANSDYYAAAIIGDSDGWDNASITTITPLDTEPTLFCDGASIKKFSGAGVSKPNKVALMRMVINDGEGGFLHTMDGYTGAITIPSDVSMEMYGGTMNHNTSSMLRLAQNNTTFEGDATFIMEGGTTYYLQMGWSGIIKGDSYMKIGGDAVVLTNAEGPRNVNGTVYSYVYGNASIAKFCSVRNTDTAVINKVINYVQGGTINVFYSLSGTKNCMAKEIENNLTGGTIKTFYGTYQQNVPTIVHNLNGTNIELFYGTYSTATGTVNSFTINMTDGTIGKAEKNTSYDGCWFLGTNNTPIKNATVNINGGMIYGIRGIYSNSVTTATLNINGGTFRNSFNGIYGLNSDKATVNVTNGNFESSFYAVYTGDKTIKAIETNISGGKFTSTGDKLLGGYGKTVTTSVKTTISGNPVFNGRVYLSKGSYVHPGITTNLEATIKGGTFNGEVYGGTQHGIITDSSIVKIEGGTFTTFYAGSELAHSTELKTYTTPINTIIGKEGSSTGPTFTVAFYSGDDGVADDGNSKQKPEEKIPQCADIITTVYGGTFEGPYFGGSCSPDAKQTGTITNNIHGGTFNTFYGIYNRDLSKVENNIYGGTFTTFYGSWKGTITDVINNISGGSFKGTKNGDTKDNGDGLEVLNGCYSSTVTNLTNNFTGGSLGGVTAANQSTVTNVKNTVDGATIGRYLGTYKGKVTNVHNIVKSGTFTGYYDGSYNSAPASVLTEVLDGTFESVFYPSWANKATIGSATCTISGGTFGGTIHMGYGGCYTTMVNNISGGTFKNASVYLGPGSDMWPSSVDNLTNNITGGDFTETLAVYGGGKNCLVKGDITNNILGGSFGAFYGGSYSSYYYKSDSSLAAGTQYKYNSVLGKIVNTFGQANGEGGPTFESNVFGGDFCSRAEEVLAYGAIENTINAGIFKDAFYGGTAKTTAIPSSITTTVNGGTFNGDFVVGGKNVQEGAVAKAEASFAPTKGNVTILGAVESKFANEKVNLLGGEYQLILGADASIEATSATGNVKLGQAETWNKQTYVTMPEGNDAVVTVTGTHCFDKVGNSVVAVKGGVQLYGATMILTDRVAVRALFDKASVDAIDNFTFSFTMDGNTLASGTKADLVSYNDDYYCIVLAKIGVSDFTETVTFSGNDMVWENTFSIDSLAKLAEDAWAGDEVDVALAKAMQNFAAIVAGNTLPYGDLKPDLSKLGNFKASASKDDKASFNVTGKGLVMSNAVGIRIYGTSEKAITANSFTIKVNGTDVTAKALVGAGANVGEYTIDLFVNAKNMSDVLTIEIVEKDSGKLCVKLIDRVDAIAAAYDVNHGNYEKAQQLLIYIQAAVAYASK